MSRQAITTLFFRIVLPVAVALLFSSTVSRAQQPDFSEYHRAADYCRGNVARPMALSPDKRILCFDGYISGTYDYSAIEDFEQGGVFVVRSSGGDGWVAQWLGDLLQASQAIIVTYDYCLSACAQFVFIASEQAFVLKNSLVAWHDNANIHRCPTLVEARDGGPKRLRKVLCADAPRDLEKDDISFQHRSYRFFKSRLIDPEFEMPPESVAVRRRLQKLLDGSATCPLDLMWTWHPRYYAATFKAKVFYEKYPESQHEVDDLTSRFELSHVIFDP
jgi:hypothetical protein